MASATAAASGATAKTSITSTALITAKVAMMSPLVGVVALGGIIAFELWKGSKDAQKFVAGESCATDASK